MDAGGRKAYENIALTQIPAVDDVFSVNYAYRESRQIVFVLGHESRMFRGLTADKGASGLLTPFRNTLDDLSDLLGMIFAAGYIIQEEQRLAASAHYVIDAHCDRIDTYRVMFVHKERDLDLCSASVGSRNEHRIFHVFVLCHRECPGKTSEPSDNFRTVRFLYKALDQFHRLVSGFDINP